MPSKTVGVDLLNAAIVTAPAPGTVETWPVANTPSDVEGSPGLGATAPYDIRVDPSPTSLDATREFCHVTSTNPGAKTITLTRGYAGSTPKVHALGHTLTHIVTGPYLNALAPIDSPGFTGTPTVPTAAPGTNTTQAASTAFATAAIAALVASSPATLDTLNELATALGNDPNFATTITNLLATKAPLASPALSGTPTAPTAAPGTNTTQLATTAFARAAAAAVIPETQVTYLPTDLAAIQASLPTATPASLSGLILDVDADRLFSPALSTIATDVFTGADNASSIAGRTTTTGAKTWTANLGTWGISGNKAYVSAGAGLQVATIDAGQVSMLVQADLTYQPSAVGLILNYVDANNYIVFNLATANTITVRTAGVSRNVSQVYNLITLTNGQTYKVTLMRNGTSVQLLVDGVLTTAVELTGAEVTALASNLCGLYGTGAPNTVRWDNFLVQTPGAFNGVGLGSIKEWSLSGATVKQTNPAYLPVYKVVAGHGEVQGVQPGSGLDIAGLPGLDVGEMTMVIVGRAITTPSTVQQIVNIGGPVKAAAILADGQFEALNPATGGTYENSGLAAPTSTAIMAIVGSQNFPTSTAEPLSRLGPGVYAYVNGASTFRTQDANSAAWGTGAFTTGYIGGRAVSQSVNQFLGGWRRILLYNRALTFTEMRQLITYLGANYGVATPAPRQQIDFDGDSMVSSQLGTTGGLSFPDRVLLAQPAIARAFIPSITGQTIIQMAADAATQVDLLYDPTLPRNVLFVWAGTNDLTNVPSNPTAAFNNLKAYGVARRAVGWKVIVLTCLPRENSAQYETDRQAFNASIRADTSFYDALVDIGADATIGVAGAQNNTTYFQTSKIHLTSAGYAIVATLAIAALATIP